MKWIAFGIVVSIATTALISLGVEISSWQNWVIVACLIAAYAIGYLSGRLNEGRRV